MLRLCFLSSLFAFFCIPATFTASEPKNPCSARLLNEPPLCISASGIHPNIASGVAFSGDLGSEDGHCVWFFTCAPSLAPVFDAPGVGSANRTTPETMMNRLLFILKMLRRKTASSMHTASTASFPGIVLCLPPPVSERNEDFEPPKMEKYEKLFPSSHPLERCNPF